jgi:hypothetical protein
VQDPSERIVDNVSKIGHEATNHFRNKKKDKIEDLGTNYKMKIVRGLYRGFSDFKNGYQPRTTIVKEKTGDLVTDSYSILGR